MNLLVCGIDVEMLYGLDEKTYISKQSNVYWDRLNDFPEDVEITILARKKNLGIINENYIPIEDVFPNAKVFFVPKPISKKEYFKCLYRIWKIISIHMRNADCTLIRYQGHSVFIACSLARKFNVKQLVELGVDQWDAFWNYSITGKILALPMWLLCKYDIKHSEYVHYVTERYLQKKYPTCGKYIGLSNVELEETDDAIMERRIKKIKEEKKKITIGTAAAVNVRYKGQQFMIEALKHLAKHGITNIEYQIAGQGDDTYLRELAIKLGVADQVKFLGVIPHDDIFKWLDSIDIYIQPSLQEGLPRAMIEAMSRGLPCIGARTAGIPELIDEKYVYSHKQMPEKIADCIERIKTTIEMTEQAKKNYSRAQNFKLENVKTQRKKFYQQFIDDCSKMENGKKTHVR